MLTLSQHLAILWADFLFLRHHPERDWMASWVSLRLTRSRRNWDSSNFSLLGVNNDDIFDEARHFLKHFKCHFVFVFLSSHFSLTHSAILIFFFFAFSPISAFCCCCCSLFNKSNFLLQAAASNRYRADRVKFQDVECSGISKTSEIWIGSRSYRV